MRLLFRGLFIQCQYITSCFIVWRETLTPVVQEKHSLVFIIVAACRAVDDDTSQNTFPCLERKVRVIPRTSVLSCSPGIGDGLSGCSRTLSDGSNTVMLVGVVLANTVEMKTGSVVCKTVVESYCDSVTPIGKESRAGESSVDEEDVALHAIK